MPFDSNGTFNRVIPGGWKADAAANIKIRADRHDDEDDGFAAGLSTCLTKDGRTQPTANIPMNGKRLINLGTPTADNDAVTKKYVDTFTSFTTGINVAGADLNGRITFVSPTGANGLAWTGADLSWIARIATADGPGTPPVPPATLNRLVLNDKADGTGTDVVEVREDGTIKAAVVDAGSFKTTGTVTAGIVTATSMTVSGTVTAGVVDAADCHITVGTLGGNTFSSGNITSPGTVTAGQLTGTNIYSGNAIQSAGLITAGNRATINGGRIMVVHSGGEPGIGLWNTGAGIACGMWMAQVPQSLWFGPTDGSGQGIGQPYFHGDAGAFECHHSTGVARKIGGGSWAASSDKRLKNVHGGYERGLAEVLKIKPVRYAYKNNPDIDFVGVVAQDIEKIMPETVTKIEDKIDGRKVANLRQFDPSNLTYALINAVKELKGLLDAANDRIAALEAK